MTRPKKPTLVDLERAARKYKSTIKALIGPAPTDFLAHGGKWEAYDNAAHDCARLLVAYLKPTPKRIRR